MAWTYAMPSTRNWKGLPPMKFEVALAVIYFPVLSGIGMIVLPFDPATNFVVTFVILMLLAEVVKPPSG